ncbi:MAG: tetratricopeptide repeat protein, partial [Planctomycetota bacterium]|nr:tetratricopeptide repeat protein [Planctomycetota bacterium]
SIVLSTEGLNENSRGSGNDKAFDKAPPTPKKSGLEKAEEPGIPESEEERDLEELGSPESGEENILQEQKGDDSKGKVRKSKDSDTSQRGRVSSPTIIDTIIEDYSKAIELNPTFSLAYYERGLLYLERVDLDRAIADLRKALEFAPPDWEDRSKAEAQLKQAEEWKK